jgi:hypothetical protein
MARVVAFFIEMSSNRWTAHVGGDLSVPVAVLGCKS